MTRAQQPIRAEIKRAGNLPGRGLSVAGSALGSHDLLEWAWLEVEVALDRESQRPPNRFELGEHEVAPLLLKAADVAEETKIVLLGFAFRDVPGPVGIRRENLACTIGSSAARKTNTLTWRLPWREGVSTASEKSDSNSRAKPFHVGTELGQETVLQVPDEAKADFFKETGRC